MSYQKFLGSLKDYSPHLVLLPAQKIMLFEIIVSAIAVKVLLPKNGDESPFRGIYMYNTMINPSESPP